MNPFAALGLPARPGLTDEEVRAAWRQAAARTHPDRDDGGDPAAYTAAATAYAQLRTPWGRSEALADLAAHRPTRRPPPRPPPRPARPRCAGSRSCPPASATAGRSASPPAPSPPPPSRCSPWP